MKYVVILLATLCLAAVAQEEGLTPKQAKAAFAKADQALNEAWAEARKELPEEEFEELKQEQRAWMEYRDSLAQSPLYTGASGSEELALDSPEYLEAAAGLTEVRTEWLLGRIRYRDDETLTGVWDDSYGGRIEIVESDGRLSFCLSVVRGPTNHVGDLVGVAKWNESIGWFSDKGRDGDKEEETNLAFILRENLLEIIGANTSHYHGARASFDGNYTKVDTLEGEARAKVIADAKKGERSEE